MRRRIARKTLKRVGHKRIVVAHCLVDTWQSGVYKQSTIHRAIMATIGPLIDITPGTLENPKKWGMLDRDTNTWMGNSDGPLTYDDYNIARREARVTAARMDWSPLRVVAQLYTTATRKLDDVTPVRSSEEAQRLLEEGLIV